MDQGINSLGSLAKASEVNSGSFFIEKQRDLTPDPIRFLDQFVAKPMKKVTIAEEIFDEEDRRFFERFQKKIDTTLQLSPLNKEKESISYSPHSGRNSNQNSLSPINQNHHFQTKFQVLPKINRKIITFSMNSKAFKRQTKYMAVDHIIKACESSGKRDMSSYKLQKSIGVDRKIAVRYVKDIEWTSRKINEFTTYKSDIVKMLYEESKISNEHINKEKTSAYRSFNNKSLKDYKEKAKTIKGVLSKFRNRIFY